MNTYFLLYTSPVNSIRTGVSRNKVGVLEKVPKKRKLKPMLKIYAITIMATWRRLVMNNPYLIAITFAQILLLVSYSLGVMRRFIGFIVFIVYVGGILVLIRYCVILLPTSKFEYAVVVYLPFIISTLLLCYPRCTESYSFGLLYRARSILLVGMLLYLVMVAVVIIIDYSDGMIK